MSDKPTRTIKVFIASPGDLAVERRAFKDTIDDLNNGFGRGADVEFVPLGWEDAFSTVGRRSQSVINDDVDACDVFVLAMWRRWGQEAPDAGPYDSYTEEEFYRALGRFEKDGSPTIFVFFKHIDPGQMADPGKQLKKVLKFRKKLEKTKEVLYRGFADEASFKPEIDRHLVAYAKGECEPLAKGDESIVPDSVQAQIDAAKEKYEKAIAEFEEMRQQSQREVAAAAEAIARAKDAEARAVAVEQANAAKAETNALALAESAAKAALDDRVEEARQSFAIALDGTANLRILYLGYEFYHRIGDLEEAERLLSRWLAISGPDKQSSLTAAAYGNLGNILQTRGDLDGAEAMQRKALEINNKLGRLEGMANNYGNLGRIAEERKDFAEARRLLTMSQDLFAKIGAKTMEKQVQGSLDALPEE